MNDSTLKIQNDFTKKRSKQVIIQKKLLKDLEVAILEYNKVNKPKLKLDISVFILSLLNSIPSFYREEERSDEVALNSQILKKYHDKYYLYLGFFIKHGFIVKTRNYSTDNHKCNTFCFSEMYLNNELMSYPITDKTFLKKFDNKGRGGSQRNKNQYCQNERPHLVKFFNDNLTINSFDALLEIESLKNDEKTKSSYKSNFQLINEFRNQYWKYSIKPATDNRLHSNLTRSSRVLRKHILYNSEHLVGVDLKTSQPFMLSVVIKAILKQDKGLLKQTKATDLLTDEMVDALFNLELDKQELVSFVLSVLNRDFYSEFEKLLSIDFDENGLPYRMVSNFGKKKKWKLKEVNEPRSKVIYDTTRELVKKVVMEIFYSKPKTTIKEAKVFRKEYPSLFRIFICLQEFGVGLSKLLQNMEAYVLLDYTAWKIHHKYPGMPISSIHDALVTTESWKDVLKDEMQQHIKELTTLSPKLEIEDWNDYSIIKEVI
ncbi:hypothetical protein [Gaetbulibacter saemankumensis]|uniref:hypothetical protein n=1 Tax=Gaetbulibacter saemankumensis TaxID=311208 RepID=UPI0003FC863F|nr:hypothetical protein [Gaetbulibacter saemankumensis]